MSTEDALIKLREIYTPMQQYAVSQKGPLEFGQTSLHLLPRLFNFVIAIGRSRTYDINSRRARWSIHGVILSRGRFARSPGDALYFAKAPKFARSVFPHPRTFTAPGWGIHSDLGS